MWNQGRCRVDFIFVKMEFMLRRKSGSRDTRDKQVEVDPCQSIIEDSTPLTLATLASLHRLIDLKEEARSLQKKYIQQPWKTARVIVLGPDLIGHLQQRTPMQVVYLGLSLNRVLFSDCMLLQLAQRLPESVYSHIIGSELT